MSVLVKGELTSGRVKGAAVHPSMNLALASLHNGTILLWQYRMKTLLRTYAEHEGPVRGLDFHPTQPIFVSGGDDFKIRVWNFRSENSLFTLTGHLDYIRTTYFHPTLPWILSASDDQTVRLWNWQSRERIAILTGHSHYVMCAMFHPKDNRIASASLDGTLRLWDFTGLKERVGGDAGKTPAQVGASDVFGAQDAVCMDTIYAHERGVNWVAFHPAQPIIATASDDRHIKIWKIERRSVVEANVLKGHYNNVSCVVFHPTKRDLIISNSEDRTIRIWDITKSTCLNTYRRDQERYWVLACHPLGRVFLGGHDSGLTVFKTHSETPSYDVHNGDRLYLLHDTGIVWQCGPIKRTQTALFHYDKSAVALTPKPQELHVNQFSNSEHPPILVITDCDQQKHVDVISRTDRDKYTYVSTKNVAGCVFLNPERICTLSGASLTVQTLTLASVKYIQLPFSADRIFPGPSRDRVVLKTTDNRLVLYDTASQSVFHELNVSGIQNITWSHDRQYVAIMAKNVIRICTPALTEIVAINESSTVKTACFTKKNGILIYSTSTHLKYAMKSGSGIIKCLKTFVAPFMLVSHSHESVDLYYLNRDKEVKYLTIAYPEFLFKDAAVERDMRAVALHIKGGAVVGLAPVRFLKKEGLPEVSLQFMKDRKIRFTLALDKGDIDAALEDVPDDEVMYMELARTSMLMGRFDVAEKVYQKYQKFSDLTFLYMLSGSVGKIKKMLAIANARQDLPGKLANAVFLGDPEAMAEVADSMGIQCPSTGELEHLLPESTFTGADLNWPRKIVQASKFAVAMEKPTKELHVPLLEESPAPSPQEDMQDLGHAWDMEDEFDIGEDVTPVEVASTPGYVGPFSRIAPSDCFSIPHLIVAGRFSDAISVLLKRACVDNLAPLEQHFKDLFQASRVYLPGLPLNNPLQYPVLAEAESYVGDITMKPWISATSIQAEFRKVRDGPLRQKKMVEAMTGCREALQKTVFIDVSGGKQETDVAALIPNLANQIAAIICEIKRENAEPKDEIRILCLEYGWMTVASLKLAIIKRLLAVLYRTENFVSAYKVANVLLAEFADKLTEAEIKKFNQLLKRCSSTATEAIPNAFDSALFDGKAVGCTVSLRRTDAPIRCPYCLSAAAPEYEGQRCVVCELATLGKPNAVGLFTFQFRV